MIKNFSKIYSFLPLVLLTVVGTVNADGNWDPGNVIPGSVTAINGKYTLEWNTNAAGEICITMSAGTEDVLLQGKGWLGFGIPEQNAGGMAGADIVVAEFDDNIPTIHDMYATGKAKPDYDCDSSDWRLESYSVGRTTKVSVCRLLITDDPYGQDRPIQAPSVDDADLFLVIVAMNRDLFDYHGSNYEQLRVPLLGKQSDLTAISKAFDDLNVDPDVVVVELRHANAAYVDIDYPEFLILGHAEDGTVIPAVKTSYINYFWNTSEDIPNLAIPNGNKGKWHIVAFEPIIEEKTKSNIHHFALSLDEDMIYVFAGGGVGFLLPEMAGFPITNYQTVKMQTHFDNKMLDPTLVDNSGVRVYIKKGVRLHDAGLLTMGDPRLTENGNDIPAGVHKMEFECPGSCTTEQRNVFAVMMHMHSHGKIFTVEHKRGEENVNNIWDRSEYYDWENQPIFPEEFTIKPGDTIKTTCFYSAQAPVKFGRGSDEEMCIAYAYYWPAKASDKRICAFTGGDESPEVCEGFKETLKMIPVSVIQELREFPTIETCDGSDPFGKSESSGGSDSTLYSLRG